MFRLFLPKPARTALLALLALVAAAGCEAIAPTEFGRDLDGLLAAGDRYARALAAADADTLAAEEIVALGYFERGRLGLGSPFRLVDYASRDPRLSPEVREAVSFAILDAVLDGRVYHIPPEVLDRVALLGVAPGVGTARQQLDLMEEVVERAPTARGGERAVRLGYLLAEAEKTVVPGASGVAAHVAALLADRRSAREDATRLLRAAARTRSHPVEMVRDWRAVLRFRVEQPALAPLSPRGAEAEARLAPGVALSLRALAQRMSVPTSLVQAPVHPAPLLREGWLSPRAADRLLALAADFNYPPQSPVAVAVSIQREPLLSAPHLEEWERAARRAFADAAWNEERFAAAYAQLRSTRAGAGPRVRLAALQAAVFLRVWNQEEPWFPGDVAPAERDLRSRFGLAGVDFDSSVPAEWRPYFRRMLARSLVDLQRVLPTMGLRGLRVRFGPLPEERSHALAMHDPKTRTLHLPPYTGPGTLAHELTHDLDWQLAERRYGTRRGYATDLAVKRSPGDRIASSLARLSESLVRAAEHAIDNPHETRPAEVFARANDWFVAAALAREGRMGGYLTSFQDPALTGFGSTRGPGVEGNTVPTLLAILEHVAPPADGLAPWALGAYGPARGAVSRELVSEILNAGSEGAPWERMEALNAAHGKVQRVLGGASCAGGAERMRRLTAAQRALVDEAVAAAARGVVFEGTRAAAEELLPGHPRAVVDAWVASRLYGAPEPADTALQVLDLTFLELRWAKVRVADQLPGTVPSGFSLERPPVLCGGNPFASPGARPGESGLVQRLPGVGTPASTAGRLASNRESPWHVAGSLRPTEPSRWRPDFSTRPVATSSAR